ncbi:MAG: hypothetical protein KH828_04625 [Clostridiales bacterium]|nr:hypothetical protein [Clostridiales bacterium]
MMGKLKSAYLRGKMAVMNKLTSWAEEEKGASDIVAIIVVIVIILAVAAIFRTQLMAAVTSVFEKLTDFIG